MAFDEEYYQRRYCAGMEIGKHLSSGGFVDCLNDEFAIEVDWAKKWAESIGQALYYSVDTHKKAGIILLCPGSDEINEGLCRSYIYRLDQALQSVRVKVTVWECFPEDVDLDSCFMPQVGTAQ